MFNTEVTDSDVELAVIEGKLEGLFRQMYVSCTQHSLALQFRINNKLQEETAILWEELRVKMEERNLDS